MRAIIVFVFLNQYTGSKKPHSGFIANASLLLQSGSCHHGAPFYPPIHLYICSANLQTPMAGTSIK